MARQIARTGVNYIDGVLADGWFWNFSPVHYSFITARTNNDQPNTVDQFKELTPIQQDAARMAFREVASFTELSFVEDANPRTINISQGRALVPAAEETETEFLEFSELGMAFSPSPIHVQANIAGDIVFARDNPKLASPLVGSMGFMVIHHEIGHVLGLKHPDDPSSNGKWVTLDPSLDHGHYTVMSDTDASKSGQDFAQSYMMLDIRALQQLYGANFDYNATDTIYRFSPTLVNGSNFFVNGSAFDPAVRLKDNTIYRTIWDGDGNDTYDFSAYETDLKVNLMPGKWTDLGMQNPFLAEDMFEGNIANALRYYGDERSMIENAIGGSGNDEIVGNGLSNTLTGNRGHDTLDGGAGEDVLIGGRGSDTYRVDSEFDETIEYYYLPLPDKPSDQDTDVVISTAASYMLRPNVEALMLDGDAIGGFGNRSDNMIMGNDEFNILFGLGGNDTINGSTGYDDMYGGFGDDTYYVDFAADNIFEYAQEYDPDAAQWVAGGIDTVQSSAQSFRLPEHVEHLTLIDGAVAGDGNGLGNTITGTFRTNYLYGYAGNDHLDGRGGADVMFGGIGDDTYYVDVSDDLILEHDLDYDAASGLWMLGGFDHVYSTSTDYSLSGWIEKLTLLTDGVNGAGNEIVNDIIGNDAANRLAGLGRDDTIEGGAGDDLLDGGAGADTLRGGPDFDRADYSLAFDSVSVDLDSGGIGGEAAGDTYESIEGVVGSEYADEIRGDDDANHLAGLGDGDIIEGRGGNDTLTGGDRDYANTFVFTNGWGEDVITDFNVGMDHLEMKGVSGLTGMSQLTITDTAQGARIAFGTDTITLTGVTAGELTATSFDLAAASPPTSTEQSFDGTAYWGRTIVGGAGTDTVSYETANHSVWVDLARDGGVAEGPTGQLTQLVSIENVTGAPDSHNYLRGDGSGNVLTGGNVTDWLAGRGGDNTLDGRGGADIADYLETGAPVTVDLTIGKALHSAGTDTLISIEGAQGSNQADAFIGDGADNRFYGLFGDDVLAGNDGRDWLDASFGNDSIDGGTGDDTLIGGPGDDTLVGGEDADWLDGGAGVDTASYAASAAGVMVDLATGAGSGGNAEGDQLVGVEKVIGSAFADWLTGSSRTETLEGREGDDTLVGNAGADVLDGGAGTDTANYSTSAAGVSVNLATATGQGGDAEGDTLIGIEQLIGSAFDDTFRGGVDRGNFLAGDGADTMIGGAVFDWCEGGNGDDTFIGAGGFMVMFGGDGDDSMIGSLDTTNYFDGGAGNDVMTGGNSTDYMADVTGGSDTIRAGAGTDTVVDFYGASQLYGEEGDDFVTAAGGSGVLDGGDGKDYVTAANGDYALFGGAGEDTLEFAGTGSASYTGGEGADLFTYRVGAGPVTVADFEDGTDHIFLWDNHYNGNVPLESLTIEDSSAGAVISWYGHSEMVLTGIAASQLTQSDFVV